MQEAREQLVRRERQQLRLLLVHEQRQRELEQQLLVEVQVERRHPAASLSALCGRRQRQRADLRAALAVEQLQLERRALQRRLQRPVHLRAGQAAQQLLRTLPVRRRVFYMHTR